ncbi:MAG: hypothetical protein ACXW5U_14900 [Thermoanaerobaculia bacterium]
MAADSQFQEALRAVVAALSEIDAPSMIIGGVAEIAAALDDESRVNGFETLVRKAQEARPERTR